VLLRHDGVNFLQRYKDKWAEKIEPPPVELPPLPKEEEKPRPVDTVQPIHVDDAQYIQLTRALRPTPGAIPERQAPASAPTAAAVTGEAAQSPPANPPSVSPDQPSGNPIV